MCGIFGLLSNTAEDQSALRPRLLLTQQALKHRGPNDTGLEFYCVKKATGTPSALLALGHTRLSIIDLSAGGHQPMHSSDKRFTVAYNGEIYNYRELRRELKGLGYTFDTESDTEVLLAAWSRWGVAGLRRLIGMFAFAIHDRADESLTLVRNALGGNPLFNKMEASGGFFAPGISALTTFYPKSLRLIFKQVILTWCTVCMITPRKPFTRE